ncbi:transcription termination/antitermination protein NusG [Edaphobacter aggregans]|uniref:transcription termination/antitermination protein NusG n=1 Tax=Edaphobacter aggregans TaxID=570835 RepID=UPI001FDFF2DC|nr:UpxY family transcription antiterminator [Edaphobacter aggregans]
MVERVGALTHLESIRASDLRPHWYAVYTLPRHEKSIADRLIQQDLETYLPLYSSLRQWNRRQAKVELPLFPGYVFVKLVVTERVRVLTHPGVVRLVGFNGNAVAIPDCEIERLRSLLAVWKAEPYPFLTVGKQIRIKSGPFASLEGRIIRRKGKMRLIVSLEFIQRAVLLEMDAAEAQLAS